MSTFSTSHQQLARQRHDPPLPRTPVAGADKPPTPFRQRAVRLIAQPTPVPPSLAGSRRFWQSRQNSSVSRSRESFGPIRRSLTSAAAFSAPTVFNSSQTSSSRSRMPRISARSPAAVPCRSRRQARRGARRTLSRPDPRPTRRAACAVRSPSSRVAAVPSPSARALQMQRKRLSGMRSPR